MFKTSLLSGAITGFIFGTFAAVPASAAPSAEPILRAEGPIVRNPVTNRIAVVGTEFAFANNVRVIVNGVATGEGPAAITALRLDGQEIVRAYLHGWYGEVVSGLPRVEGGYVYPPEGTGLGGSARV